MCDRSFYSHHWPLDGVVLASPLICCCWVLFVVCCLLFVVCCLLFVVCCLLFVVCCLLFVVCCGCGDGGW